MRNPNIGEFEKDDLKKQVEKVLRGLGNPEPPLDLLDVRELLKLDVKYYSTSDDGFLRETISRLTIAGKQILKRPSLLLDVIKKAKISGLWIPDHKRILLDKDIPKLKHRWVEGHEIGHGLAPWHRDYLFGDNSETLGYAFHEKLESEANFTSGQLLFLQDRFSKEANDHEASLSTIRKLATTFGNTITSTLWRFVEEAHPDKYLVGIVSQHPHWPKADFDVQAPLKYLIESTLFREQFGNVDILSLFKQIKLNCSRAKGGPLGKYEIILVDKAGERHIFHFESFSNGHECLTLGVYIQKASIFSIF